MAYFLSPALGRLRFEINALWPHRDKTSDGWIGDTSHAARPSDHNPAPPDGIVRAIDIDEDLVAGLTATGEAMPLVNQIIADNRTRYVIYEGRIWTRDAGQWRTYTGPNAHRHHVHVSVRSNSGYDRDARPWNISRSTSSGTGGGGSVTLPDLGGGGFPAPAPAPIIPEDWLMALTDAEQRELLDAARYLKKGGEGDKFMKEIPGRVRDLLPMLTEAEQREVLENARYNKSGGENDRFIHEIPARVSGPVRVELTALRAAVDALAANAGADPEKITAAVTSSVDKALSDLKITIAREDA